MSSIFIYFEILYHTVCQQCPDTSLSTLFLQHVSQFHLICSRINQQNYFKFQIVLYGLGGFHQILTELQGRETSINVENSITL